MLMNEQQGRGRRSEQGEKFRNQTLEDAPQGEVLSAVYQHPVVDGVVEEVSTETNQQNHNDTVDDRSDDTAAKSAVSVSNDSRTAGFEEAGEGKESES